MLTYLLVQAGVAFLTFVFAVICINVWNRCEGKKSRIVAVVFGILSILSAVYYFLDVLLWNRYEWSMVGVKILFFCVAIVIFFLIIGFSWEEVEKDEDLEVHGIGTLIVLLILILLALFLIINPCEKDAKYDMNIIKQDPKVEMFEYELISATDVTSIEGSLNGQASGSFFLISGTMSSTVNGEIKQTDVYKFYYVANSQTGEIRLMTLNADSTPIYYVEEGEKPYLLKKEVTPCSIDYNKEPAVSILYTGKKKVTYELHIPKGSIVGNFEFNAN